MGRASFELVCKSTETRFMLYNFCYIQDFKFSVCLCSCISCFSLAKSETFNAGFYGTCGDDKFNSLGFVLSKDRPAKVRICLYAESEDS